MAYYSGFIDNRIKKVVSRKEKSSITRISYNCSRATMKLIRGLDSINLGYPFAVEDCGLCLFVTAGLWPR